MLLHLGVGLMALPVTGRTACDWPTRIPWLLCIGRERSGFGLPVSARGGFLVLMGCWISCRFVVGVLYPLRGRFSLPVSARGRFLVLRGCWISCRSVVEVLYPLG